VPRTRSFLTIALTVSLSRSTFCFATFDVARSEATLFDAAASSLAERTVVASTKISSNSASTDHIMSTRCSPKMEALEEAVEEVEEVEGRSLRTDCTN